MSTFVVHPDLLERYPTEHASVAELRRLFDLQLQKRLLQLVRVERALSESRETVDGAECFFAASAVLRRLGAEGLQKVLATPALGRFLARATDYLSRDAVARFPDGPFGLTLAELAAPACVAALEAGIEARLPIRFDAFGRLSLQRLGAVLDFGRVHAHATAAALVEGSALTVERAHMRARLELDPARGLEIAAASDGVVLRRALGVGSLTRVSDLDDSLRMPDPALERRVEDLAVIGEERWRAVLESALEVLRVATPGHRSAVDALVPWIVPLRMPDGGIHNSASAPETLGVIELSFSDSGETMAEAIAHELHHLKLNLLCDVAPLLEDGTSGENVFFSPWRNDPRPLFGVFHGAFVFQAVTDLWCSMLERECAPKARAEAEIARRSVEIQTAFRVIEAHAQLTEDGRMLFDAMHRVLDRVRDLQLPQARFEAAERRQDEHRARWERLHRRIAIDCARAERRRSSRSMKALSPAVLSACREFGIPCEIPVNSPEDFVVSKDSTIDAIGRMSILDPSGFGRFRALVFAGATSSAGDRSIAGHCHYVAGDWVDAAIAYDRVLDDAPLDLDAWRCFAFALRHLGCIRASDAWLFHPVTVTRTVGAQGLERFTSSVDLSAPEEALPDRVRRRANAILAAVSEAHHG